ncbi:hypothetical protein BKA63DRAFT_325389 [Paraphoma chrysanthemicola]|nr:hypothetical protein BKA63DRAFT_325389 [Paraphoma chrysanthemicola]
MATDQEIHRLAKQLTVDPTWVVCRHYATLYIEQLLRLQAELHQFASGKRTVGERDQALEKLLLEYSNMLEATTKIIRMRRPTKHNLKDIQEWTTDEPLLNQSHFQFFMDTTLTINDFGCSAVPLEEKEWINSIVESVIWKLIAKEKRDYGTSNGQVLRYSDATITKVARTVVLILSSILLLAPIVLLYFVKSGFYPLLVIILWTIGFTALTSILTTSRNTEVMMASAAYAAVMVVFPGTG